jgi:hypothetical protein
MDIDIDSALGPGNRLKTVVSGIEVTTELADADPKKLEELHQRQLERALEHAEDAKEATRM